METFKLDARLANDSYIVALSDTSVLLLMRNALFPWFVIVPKTTEIEFYRLTEIQQLTLLKQINLVSQFVEFNFSVDKINLASIGNIVSQLHFHIVARTHKDACWPNVVWGNDQFEAYSKDELSKIISALGKSLATDFIVEKNIIDQV